MQPGLSIIVLAGIYYDTVFPPPVELFFDPSSGFISKSWCKFSPATSINQQYLAVKGKSLFSLAAKNKIRQDAAECLVPSLPRCGAAKLVI